MLLLVGKRYIQKQPATKNAVRNVHTACPSNCCANRTASAKRSSSNASAPASCDYTFENMSVVLARTSQVIHPSTTKRHIVGIYDIYQSLEQKHFMTDGKTCEAGGNQCPRKVGCEAMREANSMVHYGALTPTTTTRSHGVLGDVNAPFTKCPVTARESLLTRHKG